MAYHKPVIKSKLHSANKVLSSVDKSQLEGKVADIKKNETESKQEAIDHYNRVVCQTIDPAFKSLQLAGKQIIVRLHKENYIKSVTPVQDKLTGEIVPIYDAWLSQVDGRMRQTDPPKWVDNPLPYIFTGTVVAISPAAQAELLAEKESIAKQDKEVADNFHVLQVGDVVHLNHFMFVDHRFYLNKQQRDFIKNPMEYRIEFWEGYVRIHYTMIEAIELNYEALSSPYEQYQNYLKEHNLYKDENN